MNKEINNRLLMGIDLGTSSVKTIIINQEGEVLSISKRTYPIENPYPDWAEQNPDLWLDATKTAIKEAAIKADINPRQIEAIGLSGQMHGLVCIDPMGNPLRPAIIWADQRSQKEIDEVYKKVGCKQMGIWTANPIDSGFMLPSLLWLKKHEKDIYKNTKYVLLPKDYIRFCLTHKVGSEPSDASSTLLFDTLNRKWAYELLKELEIDIKKLPPLSESYEVSGGLVGLIASDTGLVSGTPVIMGGSDQAMQALGQGVIDEGLVTCTIGSGGQLLSPINTKKYDKQLRLNMFCHVLSNRWFFEAAILSAGLSLKWLKDNILKLKTYKELDEIAQKIEPGCSGLYFIPNLLGARTPRIDSSSKAIFSGLTLNHNRGHLIRSVMEGVVMELNRGLEIMKSLGIKPRRIISSGGAAKHILWGQLQADIFNLPVYKTEEIEVSAKGAAILAGVGVGLFPNIKTAFKKTVKINSQPIKPNSENVIKYKNIYRNFLNVYKTYKRTKIKDKI